MQIYNTTNKEKSLYHDCLFKLGLDRSDTTTYPLVDFIRSANNWYRMTNSLIWQSTGEWEYDDSNYADLPFATCLLVAAQQDYQIPSYAQKIDRIEVKDINGDWQKLIPIDKTQLTNTALLEFESDNGLPKHYDMVGSSVFLYPAPSATTTTLIDGLKVYFSRDISEFLITDTTKEAGFVEDFHEIISIGSALDFPSISTEKKNDLKAQLEKLQKNLKQFYGSREREMRPTIKRRYNTNKRK